jgi:hypothetical protein
MLAANFVRASTQSLSIADNAAMSMGTVDCSFAGWAKFNDTATQTLFTKRGGAGNREYLMTITATNFRWEPSADGTINTAVVATTFGAVSAGVWYFVSMYHDSTNHQIGISVNNGAVDTAVFGTGAIFDGTNAFGFGAGSGTPLDGQLDSWGFWKSAPGAGGMLSAAQITALYNGGMGLAFQDLSSSLKTALISWWDFDGNANDSPGLAGNNLTNNNSVTFVAGKR